MIKNQLDSSWDVDEKTMQLICKKGRVLEELAVIMGMRAIVSAIPLSQIAAANRA